MTSGPSTPRSAQSAAMPFRAASELDGIIAAPPGDRIAVVVIMRRLDHDEVELLGRHRAGVVTDLRGDAHARCVASLSHPKRRFRGALAEQGMNSTQSARNGGNAMRRTIFLAALLAAVQAASAAAPVEPRTAPATAPVRPVTDEHYGTKIVDPYRYMESRDEEVITWMKGQGRYTRSLFDSIRPRQAYFETMSAFGGRFGIVGGSQPAGGKIFYLSASARIRRVQPDGLRARRQANAGRHRRTDPRRRAERRTRSTISPPRRTGRGLRSGSPPGARKIRS